MNTTSLSPLSPHHEPLQVAGLGKDSYPDMLSMLMDELAFGMVVLGSNCSVLVCNPAARHELDRRRVLGLRDDLLYACTQEGAKQLRAALENAQLGIRSLLHLNSGSAMVSIVVLPAPADYETTHATAILLFSKAAVYEPLTLSLFARYHQLTKTEEHVLGILCQGYSTPEIAVQLTVAVSTVRSHVRSLCAKTGACGVRSLVNLVAVLPPVASGQRFASVH